MDTFVIGLWQQELQDSTIEGPKRGWGVSQAAKVEIFMAISQTLCSTEKRGQQYHKLQRNAPICIVKASRAAKNLSKMLVQL